LRSKDRATPEEVSQSVPLLRREFYREYLAAIQQKSRRFRLVAGRALSTVAGAEIEQIQFLLGHVSVQTTEHYLGCKQRLKNAVNDCIGIEPAGDRLGS